MSKVLVIADIEGSSGCLVKSDSQLFTNGWANACVEMSKDINAIALKLIDKGVKQIVVKDFHRTGYNLLPELIIPQVKVIQGYFIKPIPGIGDHFNSNKLLMTGMHAASGTKGFIPHTLTSRFGEIIVNGKITTEAELFASSTYKYNISPIFLSGCPDACIQAKNVIPNLETFSISKPLTSSVEDIREKLSIAAVKAINNDVAVPFIMESPYSVKIKMRDGNKVANRLRKLWHLSGKGDIVEFHANNFEKLYRQLINLAYLHPIIRNKTQLALNAFNIWGRISLEWARHKAKRAIAEELAR